MELKQITESSAEFAKVAEIYLEAFPEIERVSLPMLFAAKGGFESRTFALKDADDVVGLMSVVLPWDDVLYLFYFAIDKDKRGHDYGSKALQALKEYFPDRSVWFTVEEPDENAPNNEQRLKRIRFYERADFVLTDEVVIMRGARYAVMMQKGAPYRPVAKMLLDVVAAEAKKQNY